jgi:hypothetical protein|tara:strand:+ start:67 stop:768 length:702 start_codon:yes stop_codon:yes gene_type:complete
MPAYFFDKLLNLVGDEFDFEFKSLQDLYTQQEGDPVEKLRELAEAERLANPNTILSGAGRTKLLRPGRMYMFKYIPKMKSQLPYWDMFPVGIVMNTYPDKGYFSMLNFHYLPPILRAELMDAIYPFVIFPNVEQKDIGSSMRARVNTDRVDFDFMKKRLNMRGMIPAWKRYDYKQVVGNYLYIPPIGWDTIMMLPVERMRKSGINKVWNNSMLERRQRRKIKRTQAKYVRKRK